MKCAAFAGDQGGGPPYGYCITTRSDAWKNALQTHVLVPLVTYPEASSDGLAAQTASLAARLGARLYILTANIDVLDVSDTSNILDTPLAMEQAEATSGSRDDRLVALFREKAKAVGVEVVPLAVTASLASVAKVIAAHARYHDLVVAGWSADRGTSQAIAEAIIFNTGRPTILLPAMSMLPEQSDPREPDHVAIAWDGTRNAARAVSDARFLLERATQITVMTVVGEKPIEANIGELLAKNLRSRGLNAKTLVVQAEACPIAETLQQTALGEGCQLLVMGGYGYSRIRDFILGSATQGVLSSLAMPVLLSY